MIDDFYVLAIVLLLPLTAGMLVSQVNPYHALVIRGILGAIAALVYVLFGAADVALTEALVGTMLSITLYAVAVRSSMSLRLGVLEPETAPLTDALLTALRQALKPVHLRLEILPYVDQLSLEQALSEKEIHAFCLPTSPLLTPQDGQGLDVSEVEPRHEPMVDAVPYQLQTRVPRLYELLKHDALLALASLSLCETAASETVSERAIATVNPPLKPQS
ncbi:MAG: DUF4040 domain-containing protein [Cyanobacteria bacterium P01_G01_bin.54]